MSVKMMFAAMHVETGNPVTKLVLLKLADNADDNGVCWPSHNTIARICEISVKTSQRHVKKLEKLGLLSIEKRKGEKGNDSNKYVLNLSIYPSVTESPTLETESRQPRDRESLTLETESRPPSVTESPPPSVTESPESVSSFNQSMNQSIEPLSQSQLDEFIEHRKKIKKPMTDLAIKKFKNLCRRYHNEGYDIQMMIDDAIMNGWQSLVEKPKYKTQHHNIDDYDCSNLIKPAWLWESA